MMTYLDELKMKTQNEMINDLYNSRVGSWADYENGESGPHGTGKRIPYIGWFWRPTDFVGKKICIGDAGQMIGVMERNKWGYPARWMTEEEVDKFIEYLERAFTELDRGGVVSELEATAEKVFVECWQWFQTLKIEELR
jgi:hypothetical protein